MEGVGQTDIQHDGLPVWKVPVAVAAINDLTARLKYSKYPPRVQGSHTQPCAGKDGNKRDPNVWDISSDLQVPTSWHSL